MMAAATHSEKVQAHAAVAAGVTP